MSKHKLISNDDLILALFDFIFLSHKQHFNNHRSFTLDHHDTSLSNTQLSRPFTPSSFLFLHALKVSFDLTFLENDEVGRSCYTQGSSYTRGEPFQQPPPQCDATDSNNLVTVPKEDCVGTCRALDVITSSHITLWKTKIIPAVNALLDDDLIQVKPQFKMPNDTFLLNATNNVQRCQYTTEYGIPIPQYYKTPLNSSYSDQLKGVDLVVFVTMRPLTMTVKGSGMMCVTQTMNGVKRPVMGLINISPGVFNSLSMRNQIMTVLHMMYHILGFNLQSFKDAGLQLISTTDTFNSESKTIFYLNAPNAVAQMKSHFSCQDQTKLNGLPLENYEELIIPFKYTLDMTDYEKGKVPLLESRIFFNELMSSTFQSIEPSEGAMPSKISLAVLQDLGYYSMNDSSLDLYEKKLNALGVVTLSTLQYVWGRSQGCSMLTQRCEFWEASVQRFGYFCSSNDGNTKMCTFDLKSKGKCDAAPYATTIPPYYVHFSGTNKGGLSILRDYCPIVLQAENGDCTKSYNKPSDAILKQTGESYGTYSGCFFSNLVSQESGMDYRDQQPESRCYEYSCGPLESNSTTFIDTYLFVKIGNYWLKCPKEGGVLLNKANQYNGQIECPRVDVLCNRNSTRPNYSASVADQEQNKRQDVDIWKWARDLSWWVWLIIGLGVGAVILLLCFFVVCLYCRKVYKKRGKWNTTKTIDIRDIDIQH
ncbi:hypothetical protein C9374_003013 [Naegleria lovaniensis]|uniref:leishmanolysin n=1 Tax=Naegleria lovaniensis TaxID=51637 RepID=A0AA88GU90_NAELO|nr:uncharacterized protein C9374_003013 [Naegleria lovaniensis]KAG2385864.1 hypothetical protein C9374_003013 [Naegleria lovaniensis]